jgi:hypothetical protein
VLLSGCASAGEPFNDARIEEKVDRPATVYSMPDGFANFAEKCDNHGNLVATTREGAKAGKDITMIADPVACAKYDTDIRSAER